VLESQKSKKTLFDLPSRGGHRHDIAMTMTRFDTPIETTIDGHRLTLIISGKDRLQALLAMISGATTSLRLFYYIFADDAVAVNVRDALIAARRRGVRVWLIVDGFGSAKTPESFYAPLVQAGATVARFSPRWGRHYLLRNHQKMLIADEASAMIGGANVAVDYYPESEQANGWHDLSLLVEGQSAERLARYFDRLRRWVTMEKQSIRGLVHILGRRSDRTGALRWLMGGPFQRLSPLVRTMKLDLDRANRLDMIQAYFAPNWGMLRRIGRIVKNRGGIARVVTAGKSDNQTTIAAARYCYRRLLSRGVSIYEYLPQKLHMKLIIVDDIVYIGSANFDVRSLFINTEIMFRIEDRAFAEKARTVFGAHLAACEAITDAVHRKRGGLLSRLRWLLSYYLVSTVDFTVTRRINLRRL
jgi:cardiolipin synthase A/B